MNLDDFCFMRHGKQIATLKQDEKSLLAPVSRCNGSKNHALLMLHGFSSTPAVYRKLINHINDYDAVILPALPGHASTLKDFSEASAAEWLSYSGEICEDLVREYKKVDILGFSMGGLLACHLSNQFLLNHLYLLAPALKLHSPPDLAMKTAKVLSWFGFHSIRNAAGNLYTDTEAELSYRQLPLTSIREILTLISQHPFTPPSCPTDIFLGCHDAVVDSQKTAEVFADNEKFRIHWLQNSAHLLPLDGDIQEILDCIHENMAEEAARMPNTSNIDGNSVIRETVGSSLDEWD